MRQESNPGSPFIFLFQAGLGGMWVWVVVLKGKSNPGSPFIFLFQAGLGGMWVWVLLKGNFFLKWLCHLMWI